MPPLKLPFPHLLPLPSLPSLPLHPLPLPTYSSLPPPSHPVFSLFTFFFPPPFSHLLLFGFSPFCHPFLAFSLSLLLSLLPFFLSLLSVFLSWWRKQAGEETFKCHIFTSFLPLPPFFSSPSCFFSSFFPLLYFPSFQSFPPACISFVRSCARREHFKGDSILPLLLLALPL